MKAKNLLKKAFLLLALVGGTTSAWGNDEVIFSWSSTSGDATTSVTNAYGTIAGYTDGGSSATEASVNVGQSGFKVLKCSGKADFSTNVIKVTLKSGSSLKEGDVLTVNGFSNKNSSDSYPSFKFSNTYTETFGSTAFANMNSSSKNYNSGNLNDAQSVTLTASAEGVTSFLISRGATTTNFFVTSVTITRTVASEAYTVSFNAGDHGTYTGGDIEEDSPGAGITLPDLTTLADGYAFNGWYTASSGGIKAGDAGDTYHPSDDVDLYAQYSEIAAPSKPTISGAATVFVDASVTLTASAESPLPITGYKWYKGEDLIEGETSATYSPSTEEAGATSYKVIATNSMGDSDASDPVTVTVIGHKTATCNSYFVAADEVAYRNQQIIGDDITMTFENNANGVLNAGVLSNKINSVDARYIASITGDGNSNGWGTKFRATKDGVLSVGVFISKNKTFSISGGVTSFSYIGQNEDGDALDETVESSSMTTPNTNKGILYVEVTFNVNQNTDYKLSVGGSKMGFFGFRFAPSVSLNSSGYATYSNAFPVKVVSGADAYTAVLEDETINCEKITSAEVPAGNGVLLYGVPNATVTLTPTTGAAALGTNNLKATTQADGTLATKGENFYYSLSGNTFKKFTGAAFVHNKAYFEVDSSTSEVLARGVRISFGGITGIDQVDNGKIEGSLPVKRIVNGKLVIEKKGHMFNANGQLVK